MASSRTPFKRVSEAFDELAKARLCESSSRNEHTDELSDLISSFMEGDDNGDRRNVEEDEEKEGKCPIFSIYSLGRLLELENEDVVKAMIRSETEKLNSSSFHGKEDGFNSKRLLMSKLRERGLDAGVCASQWERNAEFPAGDYEYIDVRINETRYIVEVNLAGEFTIARPTSHYQSLLNMFPPIYVGEPTNLKEVVELMSNDIKESMKNRGMHVPPWRRKGYLLAKWFEDYKRTTNVVAEKDVFGGKRRAAVGVAMSPLCLRYCRIELGRRPDLRAEDLAQVLSWH